MGKKTIYSGAIRIRRGRAIVVLEFVQIKANRRVGSGKGILASQISEQN